jgi:hypothetical protein
MYEHHLGEGHRYNSSDTVHADESKTDTHVLAHLHTFEGVQSSSIACSIPGTVAVLFQACLTGHAVLPNSESIAATNQYPFPVQAPT